MDGHNKKNRGNKKCGSNMRISTGDILAVELLTALFSMIYRLRDVRISFGEKRQQ